MSRKDDDKKRKRSNIEKALLVLVVTVGLCVYAVSNILINNDRNTNASDVYPSETPDLRLSLVYDVIDSDNFTCGSYVFTDEGISIPIKAYDSNKDALAMVYYEKGIPCLRLIIDPPVKITKLDDSPIGSTIDNGTTERRNNELNWISVRLCNLLKMLPNCGNDSNINTSTIRDLIDSITSSDESASASVICGVYLVNFEYSSDNNSLIISTTP